MKLAIRNAQFAGKFYPESKEDLDHFLQFVAKVEANKINVQLAGKKILGGIVPHAGYVYSGYHAVHFYQILKLSQQVFDTAVIINPNHTGMGTGAFNLSCAYQWETPLGTINQDKDFMNELNIECYEPAHENEHSGEVQLPFLQKFVTHPFKIVMITMNHQSYENALLLAQKLHHAVQATQRKIMVIASSDFSHYENARDGFEKDQHLIDQILKLNAEECFQQVRKHHITACGYGPIMTLIEYAKLISESPKMELLRRGHSGEVNISEKVVDYVSFLCSC